MYGENYKHIEYDEIYLEVSEIADKHGKQLRTLIDIILEHQQAKFIGNLRETINHNVVNWDLKLIENPDGKYLRWLNQNRTHYIEINWEQGKEEVELEFGELIDYKSYFDEERKVLDNGEVSIWTHFIHTYVSTFLKNQEIQKYMKGNK